MGGHGDAPAVRHVLPPGGDPYPPQSEWLDEYNSPARDDFPEAYPEGTLKGMLWQNYYDDEIPKLFPNAEENLRMWQDLYLDKMIDNTPAWEIHPTQLPEYHYWPMIQNEINNKFCGQVSTLVQHEHHAEQRQIPRFHKNGVPKTPPQEQLWHTPLDSNGRCDWRAVMGRWGGYSSWFSKTGWNDRFLRYAYYDEMFAWRNGVKLMKVHKPIFYRHRELNRIQNIFRQKKWGNNVAAPFYFWATYFWLIGGVGAANATYKDLVWNDVPWNYEMTFLQDLRDVGTYHSGM